MKSQETLQVTINFRDKTCQTIEKSVKVGEKVDMNMLQQTIIAVQKETNEILTTVVENEKQTQSSGKTQNTTDASGRWIFYFIFDGVFTFRSRRSWSGMKAQAEPY